MGGDDDVKYGSLFSGIGGFDLGLDRAGWTCAWQVEADTQCRALLERRWPGVQKYDDVRTVGGATLEPVDLVCGGFPCQDLSVAGNRSGLAGARSGLWWEFHRVLSEIRPAWCLIENVPGLLSSDGGRDMGAILGGLGKLGYGYAYRVLDSQFFDLAQRRTRVFIVGCLGDWSGPAQVLLEPEGVCRDSPPRREAREEVAGATRASTGRGGGKTAIAFGGNRTSGEIDVATARSHHHGRDDAEDGTGRGVPLVADPISAHEGSTYSHEGSHNFRLRNVVPVADAASLRAALGVGVHFQNVALGGDLSGTLRAEAQRKQNTGQGIATHSAIRRLTPVECERLQGFPDGWTEGFVDSPRYRMLGNAVSVPVSEWIGTRIRRTVWAEPCS